MAVSGLIMLLFLVAHAFGDLKVFFGPGQFDAYGHWLRTIGEPVMHYGWTLWVIRAVLVAAVAAHAVSAYQLSRRDARARDTWGRDTRRRDARDARDARRPAGQRRAG